MSRLTPEWWNRPLHLDPIELDAVWAAFRDHADPSALRAILDRIGPRLFDRCRLVTGDRQLAEDALQDALVRLSAARHRVRTYPQAVAWLYRTATNAARQIVRGRRRADRRTRQAAQSEMQVTPTDPAVAAELTAAVSRAVVELPESERRAIELVYYERMTHADAAAALGWSRGSVGTYVARGLRRLERVLTRRGVAVVAGPVLVAALETPPAVRAGDWAGVFTRVFAAVDASQGVPATGGLVLSRGWLTIGLPVVVACAGLVVGGVAIGWPPAEPVTPAPTVGSAELPETLQERNTRITRDVLAPQLRDQLQRFYPPPHEVAVVRVQAVGSEVEVEFRVTPPVPATSGLASRLRGRYCMVLRRLAVYGQPHGETRWYWMDPDKPLAVQFPIPFGLKTEVVRGREEFAAAERLFAQLPPDARAEPDQVRTLFGVGGAVRLPTESRGVSGFPGGLVAATADGGLFVRDAAGRWRAAGPCPGWGPVVADGRVYCFNAGGIQSRPLDRPDARWEKWGDAPPLRPGEPRHGHLFVAGERVCMTIDPQGVASRPLNDPTAGWERSGHSLGPHSVVEVGETLFGTDGKRLYKRPAAHPDAGWVLAGPWPTDDDRLVADGDRLLAYTWGPGPIYARPAAAGPDVPWEEVGRVRDPYQR